MGGSEREPLSTLQSVRKKSPPGCSCRVSLGKEGELQKGMKNRACNLTHKRGEL